MKKMLLVGGMAIMCACQPSQQFQAYTVAGELEDSTQHGKKVYIMRYDDNKLIDIPSLKEISLYSRERWIPLHFAALM